LSKKNNSLLKNKLDQLFKELKIRKNDNLIVHSNIAGFLQFNNLFKKRDLIFFFNYLRLKLGKKSTLVIPVYNYDYPKERYINIESANSHLGIFGNFILKKNISKRTPNPVFSHLVFGKLEKEFFTADHNNAFGKGTVFDLMYKYNFKILNFCCPPDTITFIHHIEQVLNVHYRFIKKFKGVIEFKKKKENIIYNYCVGKKNINYKLKNDKILELLDKKKFIQKKFGRFYCYISFSKYLMQTIKKNIYQNRNFLIK
jgi:aminoglycoside 3-N-acetyltransferase